MPKNGFVPELKPFYRRAHGRPGVLSPATSDAVASDQRQASGSVELRGVFQTRIIIVGKRFRW
jgi:hypothetical protein